MRALWLTVCLLNGCGLDSSCDRFGRSTKANMPAAPPGTMLQALLGKCSTCGHSQAEGKWDLTTVPDTATGNVDLKLSPGCFVTSTEQMAQPFIDGFSVNNNWKNCGDMVDVYGYLTNNTNVTLNNFQLTLYCPSTM
jgi:hypothetical protein